ncbi:hypothetical protein PoB_001854200 [Plakobranchus ocellatus]|uniref:Uncharacterized protein n=1 Tax=Plakobranchus ocellatus TaxID=259542 RepID=A0AAV3ZC23_9GAST|nr:hypothetical protein PoB_001854200 [Plakobranchus ocellatus]
MAKVLRLAAVFYTGKTFGFGVEPVHKKGDLRLSGPPPGQGAGSGPRTRDKRVPADLRADSPPTPLPLLRSDRLNHVVEKECSTCPSYSWSIFKNLDCGQLLPTDAQRAVGSDSRGEWAGLPLMKKEE